MNHNEENDHDQLQIIMNIHSLCFVSMLGTHVLAQSDKCQECLKEPNFVDNMLCYGLTERLLSIDVSSCGNCKFIM